MNFYFFFLNHRINYSQINDLENINLLRGHFSLVKKSNWLLVAVKIHRKMQNVKNVAYINLNVHLIIKVGLPSL